MIIHPKYYLDTNAVRSLSSKLTDCAQAEAFTSIVTVSEILGHIIAHPEDYDKYKMIIHALFSSNLPIAILMPSDLQNNAFGIEAEFARSSMNIIALAHCVEQSETVEEWKRCTEQNGLIDTYRFIEGFDNMQSHFVEALQSHYSNRSIKEEISQYNDFHRSVDRSAAMDRIIAYYVDKLIENRQDVRQAGVLLQCSYEEWKKLLSQTYDHSIDIALWVSSQYVDRKVSYREQPRKNDETDLLHLYYLQRGMKLVTDDKGLRDLVNAEYTGMAIRTQEFCNIIQQS